MKKTKRKFNFGIPRIIRDIWLLSFSRFLGLTAFNLYVLCVIMIGLTRNWVEAAPHAGIIFSAIWGTKAWSNYQKKK